MTMAWQETPGKSLNSVLPYLLLPQQLLSWLGSATLLGNGSNSAVCPLPSTEDLSLPVTQ